MSNFHFNISLSVLNHLWRNLYRSFTTVLGEAISNSWDADAKNVYIYIDKTNNNFIIIDDGYWMDVSDFRDKFLKIGYSKRKNGDSHSINWRPFIWRKWIWKLALLSWADKIHIISRKNKNAEYIGGIINNSELEKSIDNDKTPDQYPLWEINFSFFERYLKKHNQWTLIFFENVKEGIRNQEENLRKIIALYFRFSLKDSSFNIFLEGKKITVSDLSSLWENTEFFWNINTLQDPFLIEELGKAQQVLLNIPSLKITWFIATVKTPRNLSIFWAKERIWIDLFVNGRVREKDILRHIPTARIAESYMYWQVHFDDLDDNDPKIDRFTSSRESIVADDPVYLDFLEKFRKEVLQKIVSQWDKLRYERWEDWDSENTNISPKKKAARKIVKEVSGEFIPDKSNPNHDIVEKWLSELQNDAEFNIESYTTCFLTENLLRYYIASKWIKFTKSEENEIKSRLWKEETDRKRANIKSKIRNSKFPELSFLYDYELFDHSSLWLPQRQQFEREKNEYKPLRNAVMHTSTLTEQAKRRLITIYDNIQDWLKNLLNKS